MELLSQMQFNPVISGNRYQYEGKNLPRVTEILSKMLHEDFLMIWSNSLGWKRKSYTKTLQEAADIGGAVHDSIEKFLMEGKAVVPMDIRVQNAFEGFLQWYKYLTINHIVRVIDMEQQLTCQWYGGTFDLLIEVNGLLYLVDFKTSKHIGYRYFIQMSVYRDMIEKKYGRKIDGIIILQLDKENPCYYEHYLNMHVPAHKDIMDDCLKVFHGLVYSFYGRIYLEQNLKNYIQTEVNY